MNFPMQANGAEMMRMAAIAATEAGIEVCCPIHDAFLIAAPMELIDEHTAHMREIMDEGGPGDHRGLRRCGRMTSRLSARRIAIWTNAGRAMWDRVMTLLERLGTPAPGSHEREPNLLTSENRPSEMRWSIRPSHNDERAFGLWG